MTGEVDKALIYLYKLMLLREGEVEEVTYDPDTEGYLIVIFTPYSDKRISVWLNE